MRKERPCVCVRVCVRVADSSETAAGGVPDGAGAVAQVRDAASVARRAALCAAVATPLAAKQNHKTNTNMQVRQWLAIGVDPNIADFEDPDEADTPLLRAATYDRSEVIVCV